MKKKNFWKELNLIEHLEKHPHEARLGIWLLVLAAVFCLGAWTSNLFEPSPPTPVVFKYVSPKEISHGDKTKRQVIFTFDGGSGAESGEAILAALAKHSVKGTFFLTGKFIEANPDLVRKMIAQGEEVFSHTYDHPHLPTLSDADIASELDRTEAALMRTASTSPKPYFRAPYGDRDVRVLDLAYEDGYESVYWTVDAGDWEEPDGKTAGEVENVILSNVAPGNIYLMHVGDTITGSILDDVFTKIEAQGYRIVSLTQGL